MKGGTSGWIRTITVPLNRRADYCYPTLVSKNGAHTGICTPVCRLSVGGSAIELCGQVADHRRMGMRGGDCRRQPARALLAGARASTRRVRLMAPPRHPSGCAAHSLSRSARLSGSSSKVGCRRWIRTIIAGSKIRSPACWTTRQKSVPGRNCTCGLKVRNLAFCLLNYGDEKVGPPPGLAPGSRPYQGRASLSMLRRQTAACR